MAITELDVKNYLLKNARALGNSRRGLKEVCSDLVNAYGTSANQLRILSAGTFLSVHTLKRVSSLEDSESGAPYRPNADTCERILRYFGTEIHFNQVQISPKFANKPKQE